MVVISINDYEVSIQVSQAIQVRDETQWVPTNTFAGYLCKALTF